MKRVISICTVGMICMTTMGLFTACSGGGAGDTSDAVETGVTPTNLFYAELVGSYIVNVPIAANVPSVTGEVTSYTIDPALPAGLSLDPGSGVISGTPTAESSFTGYTVTASNDSDSTETSLAIAVAASAGARIEGTLTLPTTVTDRIYTVMVDDDHDGGNGGIVAGTGGRMSGTTVDYSIENVPPGVYMVYAVVYGSDDEIGEPGYRDYTSGDSTAIVIEGTNTYSNIDRTLQLQFAMYGTWHWTGGDEFSMNFSESEITFAAGSQVGTIVYEEVDLDNYELVGRITAHFDETQIGNYHKLSWVTPEEHAEVMAGTDSTMIIIYKEADSIANAWNTVLVEEQSQLGFYTRADNPPDNDFVVVNIVLNNVPLASGEYEIVFERTFGDSPSSQVGGPVSIDANGSAHEVVPVSGRGDLIDGEDDPYTIWFDTDGNSQLDTGEYFSTINEAWEDVWSGINLTFDSWSQHGS